MSSKETTSLPPANAVSPSHQIRFPRREPPPRAYVCQCLRSVGLIYPGRDLVGSSCVGGGRDVLVGCAVRCCKA